jgi:hypothetical protein
MCTVLAAELLWLLPRTESRERPPTICCWDTSPAPSEGETGDAGVSARLPAAGVSGTKLTKGLKGCSVPTLMRGHLCNHNGLNKLSTQYKELVKEERDKLVDCKGGCNSTTQIRFFKHEQVIKHVQ